MPTAAPPPDVRPHRERKLTGRTVLLCVLGLFGTVAAVNAIMIHAAISTRAGTEKISSYRAGLNFTRDREAVRAQDALHWQVEVVLPRRAGDGPNAGCAGERGGCAASGPVSVSVRDAAGAPLRDLDARLTLTHPTDSRHDRTIVLAGRGEGTYAAWIETDPGQWIVTLDLHRDGGRLFRSSNRVLLQ